MLSDGQPSPAYMIFSLKALATVRRSNGSAPPIWASIAATEREREVGLSMLTRLAPQEGMLFTFPFSGRHLFTLAETSVSLDVIFLRSLYQPSETEMEAEVTQVCPTRARTPEPVVPNDVIDLVLEIGYGTAAMLKIKPGSKMLIRSMTR